MLHVIAVFLVPPSFAPVASWTARESIEARSSPAQDNPEYEVKRREAGDDVDKLWQLYLWCKDKKLDKEGKSTLRRIVRIDPKHQEANEALGNVFYDGKWFPSQKKVDEYKKEREEKKAKESGLVNFKGQLVPAADVPFLEKGLVKDAEGKWVDGEEQKKIKEGWVKQDFEWVAPADKPQMEQGLWKCGDKWLTLEEANKYHTDLAQWWRIPGPHFTLYTTCDREVAIDRVRKNLEFAWEDLAKVFGQEPKSPVTVVILRNEGQYGAFAAGDQEEQRPPTESDLALSSVHYAYFADAGFDPATGDFMSAGVSYWDASTDKGNAFGRHSVRHALGQAFAEALDPSPKTLEKMRKLKRLDAQGFWAEKKLPGWVRWGAAGYAERFFVDTLVDRGGNPNWAKKWSVENLIARGGLRSLKQVFECKIVNDGQQATQEDSQKLTNEVGLVMAFVLDGNCAPVKEKFKALQEAIKAGKEAKAIGAAADAVEGEVLKHEADLRKFAGL